MSLIYYCKRYVVYLIAVMYFFLKKRKIRPKDQPKKKFIAFILSAEHTGLVLPLRFRAPHTAIEVVQPFLLSVQTFKECF